MNTLRFPNTEEDIAACWGELLIAIAGEHGAPAFAWHMAEAGCAAETIRGFADAWQTDQYDPPEVAYQLRAFAVFVADAAGTDGRSWWHECKSVAAGGGDL